MIGEALIRNNTLTILALSGDEKEEKEIIKMAIDMK